MSLHIIMNYCVAEDLKLTLLVIMSIAEKWITFLRFGINNIIMDSISTTVQLIIFLKFRIDNITRDSISTAVQLHF